MKSEWKETPLSDIVMLMIDHRGLTPKKLGGDWSDTGYRALSAKNVKTGKIVQEENIRCVSEIMYHRWMPEEIQRNDILITSEAPFGQIYLWDSDEKIVLSQRLFGVRVSKSVDPAFVYYYMLTDIFQGDMRSRATGTTVIGLRQPELLKCKIAYPELKVQKKISGVLRDIDKKIALNESINENLAQQAQAIFMNMFAENETVIPATIADVAINVTDGVHNTVHDSSEGEYLLLSCKNIKGGSLNIGPSERRISFDTFEKLRRRTKLSKGDVLISSVGTIGELLLLNVEPSNYEFQRSVAMVKPNQDIVSSAYLYESLVFKRSELINAAHGAVQQCLFISDIAGFPIGIPQPDELCAFNAAVTPMFDIISANEAENQKLTEMRDTLLPKLMSGELDVSNFDP